MNIQTNMFEGSYKEAIPYIIQCITPLHVGTGESYEMFVDLQLCMRCVMRYVRV